MTLTASNNALFPKRGRSSVPVWWHTNGVSGHIDGCISRQPCLMEYWRLQGPGFSISEMPVLHGSGWRHAKKGIIYDIEIVLNSCSVTFLHVLSLQFTESAVQLRTQDLYSTHCDGLGGPLHDHIATTYGIVCNSVLNSCCYFYVTDGLVPDIMHDILEGSLELCMRQLLIHFIREDKVISLEHLNARIASFKYGPSEVKNKPTTLASTSVQVDGRLKQSGMFSYANLN